MPRQVEFGTAFTFQDKVDIQPIHYVYEEGWIYGRTSEGAKITTLAHSHWLAFEVDEVRGIFDWASVVLQGAFYRIDPDARHADHAVWAHAVKLLATLVPETLTVDDPVAFRTVLFRIAVESVSGRTVSSAETAAG